MKERRGFNAEVDHYEELYGEEPSTQRIPKTKKVKSDATSTNSKKNKIDKKNAVKAPWKQDLIPTTIPTDRD